VWHTRPRVCTSQARPRPRLRALANHRRFSTHNSQLGTRNSSISCGPPRPRGGPPLPRPKSLLPRAPSPGGSAPIWFHSQLATRNSQLFDFLWAPAPSRGPPLPRPKSLLPRGLARSSAPNLVSLATRNSELATLRFLVGPRALAGAAPSSPQIIAAAGASPAAPRQFGFTRNSQLGTRNSSISCGPPRPRGGRPFLAPNHCCRGRPRPRLRANLVSLATRNSELATLRFLVGPRALAGAAPSSPQIIAAAGALARGSAPIWFHSQLATNSLDDP
jgi:hypothetical protein